MKFQAVFFLILFINSITLYAQKQEAVKIFGDKNAIVYDICFSKHGSILAVPQKNNINIYETSTQKLLCTLSGGHTKDILSLDISPDSTMLVSGGKDSLIILWNIKTQKIIQKLDYHKGVVTSVKFSPDQSLIASGSSDNTAILYNLPLNQTAFKLTKHTGDVSALAFDTSGKTLATASEDKTIMLWNTQTGELINELKEHKRFVRDIKFNSTSTRLISCDDNSELLIWKTIDYKNIKLLQRINTGHNWLLSVDFNQDDNAHISAGTGGKVYLETNFGKESYNPDVIIHRVLFEPNNKSRLNFAVATRSKGVLFIDVSKYNGK